MRGVNPRPVAVSVRAPTFKSSAARVPCACWVAIKRALLGFSVQNSMQASWQGRAPERVGWGQLYFGRGRSFPLACRRPPSAHATRGALGIGGAKRCLRVGQGRPRRTKHSCLCTCQKASCAFLRAVAFHDFPRSISCGGSRWERKGPTRNNTLLFDVELETRSNYW